MAKNKYYRVECLDTVSGKSVSGMMDPAWSMLRLMLDIPKDKMDDAELLHQKLNEAALANKIVVTMLWTSISELCSIPVANEHKENADDVCLYFPWVFFEDRQFMRDIDRISSAFSNGRLRLVYREMYLDKQDIYYSDNYQIIIPRHVYDGKTSKYHCFE